MRLFKIFNRSVEIRTKSNRDNLYTSVKNAKNALIQYLRWTNRKIKDKNLQLKTEDCSIKEYELVETNIVKV